MLATTSKLEIKLIKAYKKQVINWGYGRDLGSIIL